MKNSADGTTGMRDNALDDPRMRVADAFSELAHLEDLGADGEVNDGLAQVLADAIAPATALTVTLGEPVDPTVLASNSQLAQRVDGMQIRAGEGPCQLAYETKELVLAARVDRDPRWPRFTALAAPTGVKSVLALPLQADGKVIGAINAYSTEEDAFARLDIALAALLAHTVSQSLRRAEIQRALREQVANLREALTSRAMIDQAKGILMERCGFDAETAFECLSQTSQRQNVKVRDLAERLTVDAQRRVPQSELQPSA